MFGKMICIHFYGKSETGKTTRISGIVEKLKKKKIRVACLKHMPCEKFLIKETESKDTERYAKAGANLIVANTKNEIVLWRKEGYKLKNIVDKISRNNKIQVLLIEGFKNDHYPGLKDSNDFGVGENAIEEMEKWVMNELGQEKKVKNILQKLPGINCGKCGATCFELAKKISKGEAKLEDCKSLPSKGLKMEINGMKIRLGDFPEELIINQFRAIAKCLKGRDGKKIKDIQELHFDYRI